MARANQTFFIPAHLGRLRLADWPQSAGLATVLRRLRLARLDDLRGVSLRAFQRVSEQGTVLFLEMQRLIERAGREEVGRRPLRKAKRGPGASPQPPERGAARKLQAWPHSEALPEALAEERIFIPLAAHGRLLPAYPTVSMRLQHLFEFKQFRRFGDLHGCSLSEMAGYRNCGRRTLNELRQLVSALQPAEPNPGAVSPWAGDAAEEPGGVVRGRVFIPAGLRELAVADLPVSVQLEGVLRRRRVRCLGDLDGVALGELRRSCGRKTLAELVQLIERAAAKAPLP